MTNNSDSNSDSDVREIVEELLSCLTKLVAICDTNNCKMACVLRDVFLQWCDSEKITLKTGVGNRGVLNPFPPVRGACAHAGAELNIRAGARAREDRNADPVKKKRRLIPLPQIQQEKSDSPKPRTIASQVILKNNRIKKSKPAKEKSAIQYEIPTSARPVWDYWTALGLRVPKPNTKTFKDDIRAIQKVLRGTFYRYHEPTKNRVFTCNEVKQAIARFALAATNSDYEPARKTHLQKLTPSMFFWSPYAKRCKSYFLLFTEEKPILRHNEVEAREDFNPTLTDILIRKHYHTVPENITQHTRNYFIKGAAMLKDFYQNQYLRNISLSPEPIGQLVDYLRACLSKVFGHASVKPANYASEWTFNQCLPEYLSEIGAWDLALECDD